MKSYPFQPEFIFVVVVFLLILFVSNYGSSYGAYTPYVHTSSKLPQYPYEGFMGNVDITPEAIDPTVAVNPIFDAPRSELLQGYPLIKPNVSNDPIGELSSSTECIGKAANLSNSTGGICFDNTTLGLIKTRGGNQTA